MGYAKRLDDKKLVLRAVDTLVEAEFTCDQLLPLIGNLFASAGQPWRSSGINHRQLVHDWSLKVRQERLSSRP